VILNAVYFMKTVIRIYTPEKREVVINKGFEDIHISEQPAKSIALICFIVLNLLLGVSSEPVINLIEQGLQMFA
ncbi:MAG: sodium:proton antiporter, partial [Lachnospiraceae bacterium]|nr:sodium:proton antiporter [Lachnospiraceae bacterium]